MAANGDFAVAYTWERTAEDSNPFVETRDLDVWAEMYKADGTFVRNIGSVGDGLGQFRFPYGLDMDRKGRDQSPPAHFDPVLGPLVTLPVKFGERRGFPALEIHRLSEKEEDLAETRRLFYVAATRARDLLVVPAVGDEPLAESWLEPLHKALYPARDFRRRPVRSPSRGGFQMGTLDSLASEVCGYEKVWRKIRNFSAYPRGSPPTESARASRCGGKTCAAQLRCLRP
jgi:hypothetical protein